MAGIVRLYATDKIIYLNLVCDFHFLSHSLLRKDLNLLTYLDSLKVVSVSSADHKKRTLSNCKIYILLFPLKSFYVPEGTSGGILKSHRPSVRQSVRPSVTNRVSAIAHKLLKQI